MDEAFFIFGASFSLHFVAVAALRFLASGDERLSAELFALPIAAHRSQQAIRMFSLYHCLPWRAVPKSVIAAPVAVWAAFMLARWSAISLFLGAISFVVIPFFNV